MVDVSFFFLGSLRARDEMRKSASEETVIRE
jgi:hypothetical protein